MEIYERGSAGTSALETLVGGILQLPTRLSVLAAVLVSKPASGCVERPCHGIQDLPNGQVCHCRAFSIIAHRVASCTPSGASGVRSAMRIRVPSELSWIWAP